MIEIGTVAASLPDLLNPAHYHYDVASLPHFVAALLILITGAMIWRWEAGSRFSLMFVGICSLFFFWAIGHGLYRVIEDTPLKVYIGRRLYVTAAIAMPLLVQFILTVIHKAEDSRRFIWINWTIGIVFAVLSRDTSLVIAGLREQPWGWVPSHGWAGTAVLGWIGVQAIFISYQLASALRNSVAGSLERRRLALFTCATGILYLSAIDFLNAEGLSIYPIGSIAVLLFTTLSAYVTWKFGLAEVSPTLAARQITNMLRGAVLILDRENIIRFANDGAIKVLGYSRSQMLGQPAARLLGEAFSGPNLAKLTGSAGGDFEKEFVYQDKTAGLTRDLALSADAVLDTHQREVAYVCMARDITEQRRAEREQARERVTDALTGLPNRAMFLGLLDAADERAEVDPTYCFSVLCIGIDRMRVVNDDLGYAAGDQLLREVAERLRRSSRPQDAVARVGGDEFAILARGLGEADELTAYIETLRSQLAKPLILGNQEMILSTRVGATSSVGTTARGIDLLRNAGAAMHKAKQSSSAGSLVVTAGELRPQRLRLEAELRAALETRQFESHYQPVLDLLDHRIVGFEALARWHHPDRGLIMPSEFIDLATELGLMADIDTQLLNQACADLSQMQRSAPDRNLSLSINLDEECLRRSGMVERVAGMLAANSLRAESLRIEVLERMVYIEPARANLEGLRDLGLGLYVDDFGTGYSALSRLHALPITALKIDREFVRAMAHGGDKIIAGIVALARNIGLDVIAEGVSTAAEASRLIEAGCRYVQGYYFSQAVTLADALKLVRDPTPFANQFAETDRLRRDGGSRHTTLTLIHGLPKVPAL